MTIRRHIARLGAAAALLTTAVLANSGHAADHIEAPGATADAPADIADFYAWHTDDGKIVAVLTFAGLSSKTATYDGAVLYGVHIDSDGDQLADRDIWIRFGQNGAGEWGVQVVGLPGTDAPVVGPVETEIDATDTLQVFAGVRDDPFFFDAEGFGETLMTGTIAFDSTRDAFAGSNVTAIVLQMDAVAAFGDNTTGDMWATTGRNGGA